MTRTEVGLPPVVRAEEPVVRRMPVADLLRLSARGLTVRPGRTALSALGIALGITALVGVLGLSESSRADLRAQLDALGTNLLTVAPGQGLLGDEGTLPDTSVAMIARIPTVTAASAVRAVEATVRRSDKVPESRTSGISVVAADLDLLDAVAATVREGRWLDAATQRYPAVVLGSTAARRLGIGPLSAGVDVSVGGRPFTVVGILEPVALAPELDEDALVGTTVAHTLVDGDLPPSAVYVRVEADQVVATRAVLGRTAHPAAPDEVRVSRPSDALAAGAAADRAFTLLAVGLGAVALLVGGVGIANVMVVAVLERRREIGVRRALGAPRSSIGVQFLLEAVLLSLVGGAAGVVLGVAVTWVFAAGQGWAVIVPWVPVAVGLGCALVVGSVVGLYPALRAARVPPTEALRAV
ncbi:ABC transporter permease [Cellulomonas terrae]|uniref:ABC transporter permease n=1 Tax=Cellulomonas terrae TaxID=311234 RepID=A0A511JGQ6_9CELL|nr:ABC transporter permease [Cellulomonas terrae]GEL97019.1 ABC transporter permease [Cellulomonas terrae]